MRLIAPPCEATKPSGSRTRRVLWYAKQRKEGTSRTARRKEGIKDERRKGEKKGRTAGRQEGRKEEGGGRQIKVQTVQKGSLVK
jgi:hypothetical protein